MRNLYQEPHSNRTLREWFKRGGCERRRTSVSDCSNTTRTGYLHGGDGGDRAGVGRESGEGRGGARLLDVGVGEAGGEVGVARGRGRGLHDIGAVDELALVVAEDGHLAERGLERRLELSLVVCTSRMSIFRLQRVV